MLREWELERRTQGRNKLLFEREQGDKKNSTKKYLLQIVENRFKHGIDGIKNLGNKDPGLTSLDFSGDSLGLRLGYGINDERCEIVANALKTNTTLTKLNLENNYITDEGIKAIANALKVNTTLTSLDLSWNTMTLDGQKLLLDALEENIHLTSLVTGPLLLFREMYYDSGCLDTCNRIKELLEGNESGARRHRLVKAANSNLTTY